MKKVIIMYSILLLLQVSCRSVDGVFNSSTCDISIMGSELVISSIEVRQSGFTQLYRIRDISSKLKSINVCSPDTTSFVWSVIDDYNIDTGKRTKIDRNSECVIYVNTYYRGRSDETFIFRISQEDWKKGKTIQGIKRRI